MTMLHVVATLSAGFAREDSPSASVVGAYTNAEVADAVRRVAGFGASVIAVELNHIPPGLRRAMQELGIKLPETEPTSAQRSCDHEKWVYPTEPVRNDFTGEYETPDPYKVSTQEDVDVGRFRCTQCGLVGYYTGLWKAYYEHGIPCPGSQGVSRELPPLKRQ